MIARELINLLREVNAARGRTRGKSGAPSAPGRLGYVEREVDGMAGVLLFVSSRMRFLIYNKKIMLRQTASQHYLHHVMPQRPFLEGHLVGRI